MIGRVLLSSSEGHGDHDVVLVNSDHYSVNVRLDLVHHFGRNDIARLALDVGRAVLSLPSDAFGPRPIVRVWVAETIFVRRGGRRGGDRWSRRSWSFRGRDWPRHRSENEEEVERNVLHWGRSEGVVSYG